MTSAASTVPRVIQTSWEVAALLSSAMSMR